VADGWAVHVAVADARVVAYAALDGDSLERLFVHPDFQGQGVGKSLLDFIKTQRPGGFWLTTAAESRAPKFYEREGLVRGETFAHPKYGDIHARYDWRP
jgi:GNAT superfamily N-acetyltransferase